MNKVIARPYEQGADTPATCTLEMMLYNIEGCLTVRAYLTTRQLNKQLVN